MRLSPGPLAALLTLAGAIGCGGGDTVTGPAPAGTLTSIQLSGNTDLTAVGQTNQLILTGLYSDGSTKDVTADATWSSSTTSVATVSRGVVTAVSLGLATITARFSARTASATIVIAPAGTFVLEGRVREPGGGSLSNVRVVEQIAFTDTKTDSFGGFRFFPFSSAHIKIELPDYETFERDVTRPGAPVRSTFLDAPMQRMVRINAGLSRGDLSIAPNDVSYTVGADLCNPCKLIRVISGGPATLTLRLAWTGAAGALKLWANDTRNATTGSNMTVNVPTAGGQSLVYVGWTQPAGQGAPQYVDFSLSVD